MLAALGWCFPDLFGEDDYTAPVAQPAPLPPRAPLGPVYGTQGIAVERIRTVLCAPSRGTNQSVYIWEDVGRHHDGKKIYKIGICRTDRVERRMREVARDCAADPRLIASVPVHDAAKAEKYLLRHCGIRVPGDTDGHTEFRCISPKQLAFCLKYLESNHAH